MTTLIPDSFITGCMAVPRRYKNYNEQMQAEMDKAYQSGLSTEDFSRPRYEKDEAANEGSKVIVTINGKPATGRAAGIFMIIFGLIYLVISSFMTLVMYLTEAPWPAFLFISVFFIAGFGVMAGGIRMLRKSSKQ